MKNKWEDNNHVDDNIEKLHSRTTVANSIRCFVWPSMYSSLENSILDFIEGSIKDTIGVAIWRITDEKKME